MSLTRLADQIRFSPWRAPKWFDKADSTDLAQLRSDIMTLRNSIGLSQVIVADNVCEYFYAVTDQDEWAFCDDFPCCAPPFGRFFLEMRRPSRIVSKQGSLPVQGYPPVWGWLFESITEPESSLTNDQILEKLKEQASLRAKVINVPSLCQKVLELRNQGIDVNDPRSGLSQMEMGLGQLLWFIKKIEDGQMDAQKEHQEWLTSTKFSVKATLLMQVGGQILGPVGSACFEVGDDGSLRGRPVYEIACGQLMPTQEIEDLRTILTDLLFPALLTISFMNCKNVTISEKTPPTLTKKQARAYGESLVHYKVLDIGPIRKTLSSEGLIETGGLKKSLHICRGHFARYEPERPMFGRSGLHGDFWIPAHVRGSREQGVIIKDYNANPAVGEAGK